MSNEHIENIRSGTFVMDQCGSQALFQGCLRITPPTHSRGPITRHYCFVGGVPIPVATTRGVPTPFTPNVEAPMKVLWSWYNRQCPFTLVVAIKACLEGWEIAQWDDDIDYAIYLPDARISDEGFMSNLTQGINDASDVLMSTVTLNVADWELYEKHAPGTLTMADGMSGTIDAVAYCGGPLCAALSSACNQPYDPGCENIWVGGESGFLWLSQDGGLTWTEKEGSGAGQLDLSDALYGSMDVLALYCDRDVVLVSAENGCVYYSLDGGTTWYTPTNCALMAVAFSSYLKNIWAAGNGLWKSIDDGISWTQVLTGTFVDVYFKPGEPTGVAITATATYFTSDGGDTWATLGASGLTAQDSVQMVNGTIWVAGGDGMAYTRDQGVNWTTINTDAWDDMLWLSCYVGYRITGTGNTVGPLQYTLDGGVTWWDLDISGYSSEDLRVLAACYDRLFIAGEDYIAQMVTKSRMV